MRERVLVVIPVYGHHDMTHRLLGDLDRERLLVDVVVVDNLGDYPRRGSELIVRPETNLGWAGGTNAGTAAHRQAEHVGFLWLNNDTRLSPGFTAGLVQSWKETGAGVLGPVYDCHWAHQRAPRVTAADRYRPRRRHYRAPFLDGTAMFVPATTVGRIGLLDADTFAPLGWGAEIDYCLQARAVGREVVVTELAYLNHKRSVTAQTMFAGGYNEYFGRAYPVAMAGLSAKWGDWQARSGVDPATSQTAPLSRGARLRSRR
ncbi:MAG: glycosyltransferase family 2 protein [Actinomycetota bacterium]|nr:glycosyltransferase family 2 protein [Actinomycetota bacterium]